jgi:hypothetical protein
MTLRTMRPDCNVLISNDTSVPRRVLPTGTQVPRVERRSSAWRNIAGTAEVASVKQAPPQVTPGSRRRHPPGIVDDMGRAEQSGELQPTGANGDGDDHVTARDLYRH